MKAADDQTLLSSTTQNDSGLGAEYEKEQIHGGDYLLVGKESDQWQMFVYEEDEQEES